MAIKEVLTGLSLLAATGCIEKRGVGHDDDPNDAAIVADRGDTQPDVGLMSDAAIPDFENIPDAVVDATPISGPCEETFERVKECINDCDGKCLPIEGGESIACASQCYTECEAFRIEDSTLDCCAQREACYDVCDFKSGHMCQTIFPANTETCCAEENAFCVNANFEFEDLRMQCREDWEVPASCYE